MKKVLGWRKFVVTRRLVSNRVCEILKSLVFSKKELIKYLKHQSIFEFE